MKVYKGFFVVLACFFLLFLSAAEGYSYTINASAGSGGSIWPFGAVPVSAGANQTFTITPQAGYEILDVVTDSGSLGPIASYTFTNVTADDSITASFAACPDPSPVMLESDGFSYDTIMEAYGAADPGEDTILLKAGTFPDQELFFNQDVSILLDGGKDCSFQDSSMMTALTGSLTISAGTVAFSDIGIRSPFPCEPGDPNNFIGNVESCDGMDNNCNGLVDDGLSFDNDHDGYTAEGSCGGNADDCDDNNPNIHPYGEIYGDGIDQDCDGQDLLFAVDGDCYECHNVEDVNDVFHTRLKAPDGTCADCHTVQVNAFLPGHYGQIVRTTSISNNMTAGDVIHCTSCHDWHDEYLTGYYPPGGADIVWEKIWAVPPGSYPENLNNLTCDACHEDRAALHATDTAHNNRVIDGTCANCHTSDTTTLGSPGTGTLTTADDVDTLHRSDCTLCHGYAGTKLNSATVRQAIQDGINGTQISCLACHTDKGSSHGGGTSGKHPEHLALSGVNCDTCHANAPYFKSGTDSNGDGLYDLAETDVCDLCHSPGGSFDGVNDAVAGAKSNWSAGVYDGSGIKLGKEKWCVGCHDNIPAVVQGSSAPDIAGNNTTYGYYLSIHGQAAQGVKRTTTYSQGECVQCHDTSLARSSHGVPLFAPLDDPDFCMTCHTSTGSVQIGSMSDSSQDIAAVFGKTYRHNVQAYSGLHKFSASEETRAYLSANKHVECNDCHSPHAAKAGLHASNQVHVSARTNLISASGPLTGALGAEPTWSAANWGGASSWPSTTSAATKEYQICFKCHANYNTNYASWGGADEASWTNAALEFNPRNQSYHPVVQGIPEIDPGYEYEYDPYYGDEYEYDSYGSNRLPPAFTSLVIGDSGKTTAASQMQLTDSSKSWASNQWQNWGLRVGTIATLDSSSSKYNTVKRITGNSPTQLSVSPVFLSAPNGTNTVYSIEYYAGSSTKAGTTVTDTNKNFNLYLPSLVDYVVVIVDSGSGTNVAEGTVITNTATSFTVDAWTILSGSIPGDGTVGYYFSATGKSMMCSDCHSNDTISSTAAMGPHGSAVKWMLKGRNRAWPTLSASENGSGTGTPRKISKISSTPNHRSLYDGTADGLFCLNCHSTVSFSKNAAGIQTGENVHIVHGWPLGPACINCHVLVPHGSSESRMIGNVTMPARYFFNNDLSNMYMTYFRKRFDAAHTGRAGDPADYRPQSLKQNCYTVGASVGCHHGD